MRPFTRTYSPGKILPNSRVESESLFKGALEDLRRIFLHDIRRAPRRSEGAEIVCKIYFTNCTEVVPRLRLF